MHKLSDGFSDCSRMISRVVYSPENSNIADPLSSFLPKDAKVTAPQHEEYVRFVIIDATMKVLTTPEKKSLVKYKKPSDRVVLKIAKCTYQWQVNCVLLGTLYCEEHGL